MAPIPPLPASQTRGKHRQENSSVSAFPGHELPDAVEGAHDRSCQQSALLAPGHLTAARLAGVNASPLGAQMGEQASVQQQQQPRALELVVKMLLRQDPANLETLKIDWKEE